MMDIDLDQVFKTLSHPMRRQILTWLRDPLEFEPQVHPDSPEHGICLNSIRKRADLTQSMTSQHMAVLERADLVVSVRLGQWTHFRRNETTIAMLARYVSGDL